MYYIVNGLEKQLKGLAFIFPSLYLCFSTLVLYNQHYGPYIGINLWYLHPHHWLIIAIAMASSS